ncbi:MAG TPA: hypothetical protein VF064_11170 [Pyrinomonadaceae bacterium]
MQRNTVTRPRARALLFTALFAASALCAPSAFVGAKPSPAPPPAQDDKKRKEYEKRTALYKTFLDNFRGDAAEQKIAYEAGKEYLKKYSSLKSPSNAAVVDYLRHWTAKYEEAVVEFERWKKSRKGIGEGRAPENSGPGLGENPEGVGTGAGVKLETKPENAPAQPPTKQPDNPPETDKPDGASRW